MIKYKYGGIDALQDNRGKRKNPTELSELDRLRAEVKMQKAQKERAEMEGFWGILKRERYYGKQFTDKESLVTMIEEYILLQ